MVFSHSPLTLLGGNGFLGRYVVQRLARSGHTLRVVCRNPDAALHLKTAGDVGQIALMAGNLARPESLARALEGAGAVVNMVGILFESSRQSFTAVHAQGAEKLAVMAKAAGVSRFVHVSSLGVDKAVDSEYARSKLLGERAVAAAFPEASILRPSVMFGPEDNFFNQFAGMAAIAPALPLIGGGHTRFQPVYADDVAAAVEACLNMDAAFGETYELGGPRVYSFREILEYILVTIGRKRPLINFPFPLASIAGSASELAYKVIPFVKSPALTADQVKLLAHDNVVSPGAKTFAHLGISPTAIEAVVPAYLARHSKKASAL